MFIQHKHSISSEAILLLIPAQVDILVLCLQYSNCFSSMNFYYMQLQKHLSDEVHPYHKFSTG